MSLKPNAYPPIPPFTWEPAEVRKCLPVYPSPEPLNYPTLPSPPREPSFSSLYTLTTHIIPAAHLRTARQVPVPVIPDKTLPKEQRRQRILEIQKELDDVRGPKVTNGFPVVMWNVVNRYARKGLNESNSTGVTLFVASAIGFLKEIWEPFLHHLLSSKVGASIDEVWAWESVQHGDSALVNSETLSGVWDWQDNSRDMINFFLHFMPTRTSGDYPLYLPRLDQEETEQRMERGFSQRQLLAIGHSMGGCTTALAALMHPLLFKTLVLVDPVILAPYTPRPVTGLIDFVLSALNRRDQWPTLEEANQTFSQSPFFQAWDPAVLQVYLSCALYETTGDKDQPIVRLKTSAIQEAVVYAEIHTDGEVYDQMRYLDPRIPLRWILPGRPGAPELGGPGTTDKRAWLRQANATNTRILGGGHLIPLEAPLELAEDVQAYFTYLFATNYGESPVARANL